MAFDCSTCDPGYSWSSYTDTTCYTVTASTAQSPTSPINLQPYSSDFWAEDGTRFYDPGYTVGGTGTYSLVTTVGVWRKTFGFIDGPLNRTALWTSGYTQPINTNMLPLQTWVGFSDCLSGITETKTYYVGIGADNYFRIALDGNVLVDNLPVGVTKDNFTFWHVYPVVIGAGDHVIEVFGRNKEFIAGFGCEIYDNTLEELTAATSYNDLNVIYTTSGKTQATVVQTGTTNPEYVSSGWTCSSGIYSPCSNNCLDYIFCEQEAPPNTPTPTVTPTPIPDVCTPPIFYGVTFNGTLGTAYYEPYSDCVTIELQYSRFANFSSFFTQNVGCSSPTLITLPSGEGNGIWYFRLVQTCPSLTSAPSNVLDFNFETPTPTVTPTPTPTPIDPDLVCCSSVWIVDTNYLLQENYSAIEQEDNSKIEIKQYLS